MNLRCPYLKTHVELTEERETHIREKHPELLPQYRDHLDQTLADPDEVRRDTRFPNSLLFSHWFPDVKGGKFVYCGGGRRSASRRSALDRDRVCGSTTLRRNCDMETSLTVEYDKVGDILYLGKTKAYPEQDSEELDYGVVARLNPQTHDLENLEILFFSSRVAKGETFQLPVTAEFRLPKAG